MAIAPKGMFGPLYGKVGNEVFYIMRGRQVVRHRPSVVRPRTQAQLDVLARCCAVSSALKSLAGLIRCSFRPSNRYSTPWQLAAKVNYPHVETLPDGTFSLNLHKAILGNGTDVIKHDFSLSRNAHDISLTVNLLAGVKSASITLAVVNVTTGIHSHQTFSNILPGSVCSVSFATTPDEVSLDVFYVISAINDKGDNLLSPVSNISI